MNCSNDNKATYVFLIPFFILTIDLFSTVAYATDVSALFEKALMSFEVEGVSLSTQVSALEGVLTSAGYKLKNTSKKRQQTIYSFVRGKGKTSSSVKISATPDGIIKSISISLRDVNIDSLMNSEKARYEKSFADFSHLCQSQTNKFKCHSFTAMDKISISFKSSAKAITYKITSKESTKAIKITEKRQAQEKASELALIEAAQQEELRKEKEAQRAVSRAEFAKKMADHPCFQFDVNNYKQVLTCLQTLETARVKSKNSNLPSVWVNDGSCPVMKENLGLNLKSIGFEEEAINKRIPDCKLFAGLHKEKYGADVYWSGCINRPEVINAQYINECIDFTRGVKPTYLNELWNAFNHNFASAGHTLDKQSGAVIGDEIRGVLASRHYKVRQRRKEQEDYQRAKRLKATELFEKSVYKAYYEETPERKKSKFSDAERKLMKNNKLVVPASYPPPSAEEVRLAVIRSYAARQNQRGNEAVVTDGHTLYIVKETPLIRRGLRVAVRFEEVKNLTCQNHSKSTGYMCRYNLGRAPLGRSASSGGFKGGVNAALSSIEIASSRFQTNWFILTESGWRQPYTDEQIAVINRRNEQTRKNAAAFQKENQQREQSFDNWLR